MSSSSKFLFCVNNHGKLDGHIHGGALQNRLGRMSLQNVLVIRCQVIDKLSRNIRRAFERLHPRIQVRKYLFEDIKVERAFQFKSES